MLILAQVGSSGSTPVHAPASCPSIRDKVAVEFASRSCRGTTAAGPAGRLVAVLKVALQQAESATLRQAAMSCATSECLQDSGPALLRGRVQHPSSGRSGGGLEVAQQQGRPAGLHRPQQSSDKLKQGVIDWPCSLHLCRGIHNGQVEQQAACGLAAAQRRGRQGCAESRTLPWQCAPAPYEVHVCMISMHASRVLQVPRTAARRHGRRRCQRVRRLGASTALTPPPNPSGAPASAPSGHGRCGRACQGETATKHGHSTIATPFRAHRGNEERRRGGVPA